MGREVEPGCERGIPGLPLCSMLQDGPNPFPSITKSISSVASNTNMETTEATKARRGSSASNCLKRPLNQILRRDTLCHSPDQGWLGLPAPTCGRPRPRLKRVQARMVGPCPCLKALQCVRSGGDLQALEL